MAADEELPEDVLEVLANFTPKQAQALQVLANQESSRWPSRRGVLKTAALMGGAGAAGTVMSNEGVQQTKASSTGGDIQNVNSIQGPHTISISPGVSVSDGGDWNGATVVRSGSEFEAAKAPGASIIIPSGETVNIASVTQRTIGDAGLSLWIQPGATLRMANSADTGAVLDIRDTQDVRVRVDGTIDANRANQPAGQVACVLFSGFTDGTPNKNNLVYGTGTLTGAERRCVRFDQENENCELRGVTIKDFRANTNGQQAVDFATGGTGDVRRPIDCGVRNVTFLGTTWDTSAAYADAIKGTGAYAPEAQGANYVHDCYFDQVPRRAIFATNKITDNRIVSATPASGVGGDAITGGDLIANNVLLGTFDGNGDNGIVIDSPTAVQNNYIEGFTNNGIRLDTGLSRAVEMILITGNKVVDNNHAANTANGNIRLTGTENNGGFICSHNVCWGENMDPQNNIKIDSTAANGRVTENVTQGATTEINDSSPTSTTVANNITI